MAVASTLLMGSRLPSLSFHFPATFAVPQIANKKFWWLEKMGRRSLTKSEQSDLHDFSLIFPEKYDKQLRMVKVWDEETQQYLELLTNNFSLDSINYR